MRCNQNPADGWGKEEVWVENSHDKREAGCVSKAASNMIVALVVDLLEDGITR